MSVTSAHFSDQELACRCCGVNACTRELVDTLELIRSAVTLGRGVDTPVHVDCAYRCPAHNAATAGAASNSQHQNGIAADIKIPDMTAAEMEKLVSTFPQINGIGRADHQGYIHVDLREGPRVKWCYDESGKSIKWYPALT